MNITTKLFAGAQRHEYRDKGEYNRPTGAIKQHPSEDDLIRKTIQLSSESEYPISYIYQRKGGHVSSFILNF